MNEKWVSPTLVAILMHEMKNIFYCVEDVEELKIREEAAYKAVSELYEWKLRELKQESKRAAITAMIHGSKEQIS